jgi:hypothetical protein
METLDSTYRLLQCGLIAPVFFSKLPMSIGATVLVARGSPA